MLNRLYRDIDLENNTAFEMTSKLVNLHRGTFPIL